MKDVSEEKVIGLCHQANQIWYSMNYIRLISSSIITCNSQITSSKLHSISGSHSVLLATYPLENEMLSKASRLTLVTLSAALQLLLLLGKLCSVWSDLVFSVTYFTISFWEMFLESKKKHEMQLQLTFGANRIGISCMYFALYRYLIYKWIYMYLKS